VNALLIPIIVRPSLCGNASCSLLSQAFATRQHCQQLIKKKMRKGSSMAIIAALTNLPQRQKVFLAWLAGCLCALGLPPFNLFPILWLSFPLLGILLSGTAKTSHAFWLGWCFGFGYFLVGLYWIAAALFVAIKQFYWLLPFTIAGLPAMLALYYGIATLLWRRFHCHGTQGAVLLALVFSAADYLRGHLFTGFPWNLFGYVWTDTLPVAQSISLFGIYGLTLITLLAACLPLALITPSRGARAANLVATGLIIALALWGSDRLQSPTEFLPDTYVRIVQPNIPQAMKWQSSERENNFQLLLALSAMPSQQPLTHIIWPESAVAYFLADDSGQRNRLAAALPPHTILLTGGDRRTANFTTGRWDYYNSLLALDTTGTLLATYDKFHLVPFGEYVPFQSFGPVATATAGMGSFKSGNAPQTMTLPGLPPFSPLICYEIIFPDAVTTTDTSQPRAQLLINVTNDGWYGNTAGPYQHFAIARMRAIESGLPLLRSANTGISAVIDAYGRTIHSLPLGTKNVLDFSIPRAIKRITYYSEAGDMPAIGLWFLLALSAFHRWLLVKKQQ